MDPILTHGTDPFVSQFTDNTHMFVFKASLEIVLLYIFFVYSVENIRFIKIYIQIL